VEARRSAAVLGNAASALAVLRTQSAGPIPIYNINFPHRQGGSQLAGQPLRRDLMAA
jgi:hypothetical protein